MNNCVITRKIPKITSNIRNVINYESITDKNEIAKYIIKAWVTYKSIVPKYIKNRQIQHYRFFTCCEDINREIMKGRIKHEKYV